MAKTRVDRRIALNGPQYHRAAEKLVRKYSGLKITGNYLVLPDDKGNRKAIEKELEAISDSEGGDSYLPKKSKHRKR